MPALPGASNPEQEAPQTQPQTTGQGQTQVQSRQRRLLHGKARPAGHFIGANEVIGQHTRHEQTTCDLPVEVIKGDVLTVGFGEVDGFEHGRQGGVLPAHRNQ